jgi:hypothetical protein
MTIETRTTVELKDIKAIEFECADCHTKVSYPIDKFAHPVSICYTCHPSKLLIAERSTEHKGIVELVRLINQLSELEPKILVMRFDTTGSSASPEEV